MGEFLARIPPQRSRRYPLFGEHALDQEPCSRPLLPVDETQALPGHVAEASNPCRIATRQNQTLLAVNETDQPIARRMKAAQKGPQRFVLHVDRDVETRRIDSPFVEQSQGIEAPHEGQLKLECRRRLRVAQGGEREVMACRDTKVGRRSRPHGTSAFANFDAERRQNAR